MTKEDKTTAKAAKTTSLKWRLQKAPTLDDVALMKREGIINEKEAKELLFNEVEEDSSEREKALKEQIEFLEGVIEKLAKSGNTFTVWPQIQYIPTHPVKYWYTNSGNGNILGGGTIYSVSSTTSGSSNYGTVGLNTSHALGMSVNA